VWRGMAWLRALESVASGERIGDTYVPTIGSGSTVWYDGVWSGS
jgi:hypothetical protein